MTASFKRTLVRNTVSNYIRTAVAMVVGLVTFRLLYQHFSKEEFGFWSLLWSVFGFGVLLDFGFGFAAQKRVAELSVKQDWLELSRVLSSIIVFYVGIAAVIATSVFLASPWLIQWFGVSAGRSEEFRLVMVVFFVGIGLSFPMGIFPEILRGQQRISLTNWLITTAIIARLALVIAAIHLKWSFLVIMIIALGSALAPDLCAAFFALKAMPEVKLRLAHFNYASMSDTVKFSLFAYLGTATNLVLAKTDQIVITTTLGVSAIALYQAGAKVGEMFRDFTKQVQDTLSPAAAHLHAEANHAALRDLLVQGTRWSVMIATPLYLLCAFYLDELLQLLTGDHALSYETWLVGQVLLGWYYTTIFTHSVSKRIFMMTGHERKLMWLGVAEALANLVISIVLVLWWKSVAAVALGSLIPTLWFGWMHLWPMMARESKLSFMGLFRQAVMPSWLATLPALLVLVAFKCVVLAPASNATAAMFIESIVTGLVALIGVWRFGLKDQERDRVTAKFRRQPQGQTEAQPA
jgi:O-antigen/teichoic acid export membrane protein